MLNLDSRIRPNREDVASKVLDGEAIMIDLKKGTYYSLDGVGGLVWGLVEAEHTLGQIADVVVQRFVVSPKAAIADVERLVEEMLSEGLVEWVHDKRTREMDGPERASEGRLAYRAPELCIYRDMADLLALEPPTPGASQERLWRGS